MDDREVAHMCIWKMAGSEGRNIMKSSTQDQAGGTFHETKGKVKEMAGRFTNNPRLVAEGKSETLAGNVQEKIGQFEHIIGK